MNLEDLYRLLRSGHVQAQGIIDTIDQPLVVLDDQLHVLEANRAFFATFMVERDNTIGNNLRSLGDGQWNIPQLSTLLATVIPRSTAVIDFEVEHVFPNVGRRMFLLTARRLSRPDNNSSHILLVFDDVTDDRDKERESSLLYSELRHRMTNLLSVVRALANQTQTQGKSAEEYRDIFLGRFEAVLKAQSFLAGSSKSVDLSHLVAEVVTPFGGERVRVRGGPPVTLEERQIIPFTMLLHELATNALKYGALSNDSGVAQIGWTISEGSADRTLFLTWQEEGGPVVSEPTRKGIGTKVIVSSATVGLGGTAELTFEKTGLVAYVSVPLIKGDG